MSSINDDQPVPSEIEMLDPPLSEASLHDEAFAPESIIVPQWVPKRVQRRLLQLTTYAKPASAAYALSSVPPVSTWGTDPFFQRYLCVNNTPVTIYALGSLYELDYLVRPRRKPSFSISINFLRNGDNDALVRLFKRARPRAVNLPTRVTASPALASERPGFGAIFDATAGLRPKAEMDRVNITSLASDDILLLETSFVRKHITTHTWTVSFELESVLVLVKSPRGESRTIDL